MNIIKFSVNRPVTVLMFYLLILITGVISFMRLPIDFLPDIGYPQLTVICVYDNSSPEEVEKLITKPIEEVVSTLKGVRKVKSISRDDVSVVTLKYNWGTDMAYASLSLREQLDNLRYVLPEEAERPNIAKLDPSEDPVMFISVSDKETEDIGKIQNLTENLIKRRLQQLDGVASADIIGDLEEQIEIRLDEVKVKSLGLNLADLENKISYSSFNSPGGKIRDGHYKINLKILGEFQKPKDIENTPVVYLKNGGIVLVKDIAEVVETYKDEKSITRLNAKRSLGLLIRKEANSNTVNVCKTIRETLKELQKEYPEINFDIASDQSKFINESIYSVLEAILIGGFLAFLILFLFLKDLRSPFNIAIVIPIAIITAFIMMFFNDISLNIISLSGLALGVGMLVDNSIVVSENIFRHKAEGKSAKQAALDGTKEVGLAIVASTLTTLAVFLPIIYVKGVAASLFKQQALTVTFSLLSSLIVSLTVLPLLSSLKKDKQEPNLKQEKTKKNHGKFAKVLLVILKILIFPFKSIYWIFKYLFVAIKILFKGIFTFFAKIAHAISHQFQKHFEVFQKTYLKALEFSLQKRGLTLFVFSLIFVVALGLLTLPNKEFFPEIDQSQFTILMQLEPGSPLDKTDEMIESVEQYLLKDSRVRSFFSSIGKSTEDKLSFYLQNTSSENIAEIKVNLKPHTKTDDVIDDYRKILKNYTASISFKKGDNILVSMLEFEESGLAVSIYGENLEVMKTKAENLKSVIEKDDIFFDVATDYEIETPMIELTINRDAVALYDVSVSDITSFIKTNISGEKVSEFRKYNKKIDITMIIDDETDLANLLDKPINVGERKVALRNLVHAKRITTFDEIKRTDQNRKFTITTKYHGNVDKAVGVLQNFVTKLGYDNQVERVDVGGVNKEIGKSLNSLMYALIFAIILVYMILASQFESLKLPFIVMFVAPMGVIGVSLSLVLTGASISIMSTLGMIVLSGIIVNDAILLVDYTKQLQRRGIEKFTAVREAASTRLRPILMTTFTTVFGLLPLALGIGSGAELQSPMAIAVIGGMLSATFLTLILIPVLYSVIEK
jgi:HAE1 family hydrophobic/amphiphilic exporter-1